MKYRAKANGEIVELSDEAAAVLVPAVYEAISEDDPKPEPVSGGQAKTRRPRR